jgi:hypothetical protein
MNVTFLFAQQLDPIAALFQLSSLMDSNSPEVQKSGQFRELYSKL